MKAALSDFFGDLDLFLSRLGDSDLRLGVRERDFRRRGLCDRDLDRLGVLDLDLVLLSRRSRLSLERDLRAGLRFLKQIIL